MLRSGKRRGAGRAQRRSIGGQRERLRTGQPFFLWCEAEDFGVCDKSSARRESFDDENRWLVHAARRRRNHERRVEKRMTGRRPALATFLRLTDVQTRAKPLTPAAIMLYELIGIVRPLLSPSAEARMLTQCAGPTGQDPRSERVCRPPHNLLPHPTKYDGSVVPLFHSRTLFADSSPSAVSTESPKLPAASSLTAAALYAVSPTGASSNCPSRFASTRSPTMPDTTSSYASMPRLAPSTPCAVPWVSTPA